MEHQQLVALGCNEFICNEPECSFSLRAKTWTCTDAAKLLDEDIKRPKELSYTCAVNEKAGLTCTIHCASKEDFLLMKKELERKLLIK